MKTLTKAYGQMQQLQNEVGRLLSLLFAASRWLFFASFAAILSEITFGLISIYLLKQIVDGLGAPDGLDFSPDGPFIIGLLLFGICALLSLVSQIGSSYLRSVYSLRVRQVVDERIHQQAITVDLSYFDGPDYLDTLQRARAAGPTRPAQVLQNFVSATRSGLYLGAALILMGTIHWVILGVFFLLFSVLLIVRMTFTRQLFELQKAQTARERRSVYLDLILTSQELAKEVRARGVGEHFAQRYLDLRHEIVEAQLLIERRRARADLIILSVGALGFIAVALFLAFRIGSGTQTIGDLVLFVLLFRRAETSGREFSGSVAKLFDDRLFLQQLFRFLDVSPRVVDTPEPTALPSALRDGLRLENVTLTYPGRTEPALKDISLHLGPGQVTAVVGENGSGKTSLIKLITRLYDPTDGRIVLDGQDVRDFSLTRYRAMFSVVFQDYAKYAYSAAENIWFGDIHSEFDREKISRVAEMVGANEFIESMPQKYDTPLSPLFEGGHEISIGQWQRIALSRSFFANADFVILDEPTSAIDAIGEARLFNGFRDYLDGRSALLITHRLATAQMADKICVMHKGTIVGVGTHDELSRTNTYYKQLLAAQGLSNN